ncbi:MAG TPA: hypothetical protein PLB02_02710 [Thermoanaerobaculia bacterium]|nr:hypothetical protein [Thermoanaerobaculia bacterium]HQR66283.1 hypothetical protein [Thermoanaerobaculia bacterium]
MEILLLAALGLLPAVAFSSGHGDEKSLLRGIRKILVSVKAAPELSAAEVSATALRNVLELQIAASGVEPASSTEASDATLLVFLNGMALEPLRGSRHWIVHVSLRLQQPVQLLRTGATFRGGTWHRTTMFWIAPEEEMIRAIKQRVTYVTDLLLSDIAAANSRNSG